MGSALVSMVSVHADPGGHSVIYRLHAILLVVTPLPQLREISIASHLEHHLPGILRPFTHPFSCHAPENEPVWKSGRVHSNLVLGWHGVQLGVDVIRRASNAAI